MSRSRASTPVEPVRDATSSNGSGGTPSERLFAPRGRRLQRRSRATERRASSLHEELLHVRGALEAAELGAWEYRAETGEAICDARSRELLGLEAERGVEAAAFLRAVGPLDPPGSEREAARASSEPGPRHRAEVRTRAGDGTERFVEATWRVVARGADGGVARALGTVRDMTEHRESDRARETFVAMLGHDLRCPLGSIVMWARALEADRRLGGAAARQAALIARSAWRMARMVDDLLDFTSSRLGAGIPLALAEADMRALVADVVGEIVAAHPARHLNVRASGELGLRCDSDRVMQVVSNLVGNAVSHGSDPIVIEVRGHERDVEVSVSNGGAPIDRAQLGSIFEPFRRSLRDGDRSRGLGLGLFIAAEIVRAHGGAIDARSDEEGTTFRTCWPRRGPPARTGSGG